MSAYPNQNNLSISIVPSGQALGADVLGFDLRHRPTQDELTFLTEAWAAHLVLRIRNQQGLDLNDLIRFSKFFGELDKRPISAAGHSRSSLDHLPPEITVISNITVAGKSIGALGSYEAVWHSDMTYKDTPPKGSCLYSVEVPQSGGDTSFVNMYQAYDELNSDLKRRLEPLRCVHDASRNSAGQLRDGFTEVDDPRKTVGAIHPVVRTHPVTGRKCLFLGRRRNAYIIGFELEESEALLDELWAHCTQSHLCWTQSWQLGDLVLWDNRCTMHKRDSFDPASRRLMYRTQIKGEAVK